MPQLKDAVAELEAALGRLEASVDSLSDSHSPQRLVRAEAEALRRDRAQLAMDLDDLLGEFASNLIGAASPSRYHKK